MQQGGDSGSARTRSHSGDGGPASPTHQGSTSAEHGDTAGRKRGRQHSQGTTQQQPLSAGMGGAGAGVGPSNPGSSEEQEAKLRRQQMLNKAAQQRYRCARAPLGVNPLAGVRPGYWSPAAGDGPRPRCGPTPAVAPRCAGRPRAGRRARGGAGWPACPARTHSLQAPLTRPHPSKP
jgi:hypothetical protein